MGQSEVEVLIEWLLACSRAEQRPSPAVLPALLDAATRRIDHRTALRMPTVAAVGPLGLWLCRMNPDWSALVAEDVSIDAQDVWQTGTKTERVAALRRLRARDPGAARELLGSTFASEPAADRSAFLDALLPGLSPADEPFLEAALVDRSKEVRASAAGLLSRMPDSAYVARMIARLTPLLQFTPPEAARLLRKAKSVKLAVELPAACDDLMKRDGIEPKPSPGSLFGERQHWLLQMLSMTPPSHWTTTFHVTPAQLLEAIPKEYSNLLETAWINATMNAGDAQWADAFIRLEQTAKNPRFNRGLMRLLPDVRRHDATYELLSGVSPSGALILELVTHGSLDIRSARLLMTQVAKRAGVLKTDYDWELAQLLPRLAVAVPPELLSEFETSWQAERFVAVRNPYERFFTILTLRQAIQKEFAQ